MRLIPYGHHKFFNDELTHTVEIEAVNYSDDVRVYIKPTSGTDVVLYQGCKTDITEILEVFTSEVLAGDSCALFNLGASLYKLQN